jgi:hypothetical protein
MSVLRCASVREPALVFDRCNRRRALSEPTFRPSRAEVAPRDSGRSEPPSAISLPRRVLYSYGTARRRTRGYRAVARDHPCGGAKGVPSAESRAPRTVHVGPTLGGRRDGMSQTRRLAAILTADVGVLGRVEADEEGTLECLKHCAASLLSPACARGNGHPIRGFDQP